MERERNQRLNAVAFTYLVAAPLAMLVAAQAQGVVLYSENFDTATPGNITTSNPASTPTGTRGFGATATIATAGAPDIVQVTAADDIFGVGNQYLRFTESAGGTSASLLSSADIAGLGGGGVAQFSFKAYVPNGGLTPDGILVVLNDGSTTATNVRTVNLDFKLVDTDADTIPDSPAISFQSAAPTTLPVPINYGQVYNITVAANYSTSASATYALGAESLGTTSFDVYLDGTKVRDDVLFRSTILGNVISDADRLSVRGSANNSAGTVYFDDFELQDTIGLGLPSVTIDRATGSISLVNNSGSAITGVVGYSISTPSGTLNPSDAVWNAIGDTNPLWTELSSPNGTNLSESNLNQVASPITLANNSTRNFGNVWFKHPNEDVTFQLQFDDGSANGLLVSLPVTFTGGPGAYLEGDINFDGLVNAADVTKFAQHFYQTLSGSVPGATYAQGDFNGDLVSNHADLLAFRAIYDAANGVGAFSLAMTAVPEPGSMLSLGLLLAAVACGRIRSAVRTITLAIATCLSMAFIAQPSQAVPVMQEDFNAIAVGETLSTTNSAFTTSAQALVPSNLAVIQEDVNNFFGAGINNRYLHFADGNTSAEGNANPRVIAPANLSAARGFEFSFEFYELSNAGGEDLRIGLGDAAYGANSRSIDFELKGNYFRYRGSDVNLQIPYNAETKHRAVAIGNYGAYPILYNGGNDWVLPGQFDVWLNSTKVTDNQAMANGGPKTTHLGLSGGSSDGLGSAFLDNIKVEDAVSSFSYQGEALLTLEVNTSTGQLQIKNTHSQFPLDLDFYKITGPSGSMNLGGWNSLDDQDGADAGDEGWIQATGSSSFLAEFTLDDSQASVISGSPLNLGTAYNPGSNAAASLVFQYSLNGSDIYTGLVSVVTGGALQGDFNNDGVVNLADYTVWRDNLGSATDAAINNAGDGVPGVGSADYSVWKSKFGNSSGSLATLSSNVPEPSTLMILSAMAGALALGRYRLRGGRSM